MRALVMIGVVAGLVAPLTGSAQAESVSCLLYAQTAEFAVVARDMGQSAAEHVLDIQQHPISPSIDAAKIDVVMVVNNHPEWTASEAHDWVFKACFTLSKREGATPAPPPAPRPAPATAPAAAGLPGLQHEGDCTRTTIKQIGGFNDRPDRASQIGYANGGYQTSYDETPAMAGARVGDPVTMCLISIPKQCPPGDTRGRVYTTTDMRTHGSWTIADDTRTCGGG